MEPTQALQHLGGFALKMCSGFGVRSCSKVGLAFSCTPRRSGQGRGVFGAQPRASALELGPAAGVRVCPALWLLLLMVAQLVLWAVGTGGVLAASGVEKLPCEPQTGKVELGCGELPGLFTLSLLPPTFLPFSPSSPSPSLSHCSVSHPGSPTTFLPPRLCSSLSMTVTRVTVTHGDVSPADALAAPTEKPSALASCAACSEPGKPLPVH